MQVESELKLNSRVHVVPQTRPPIFNNEFVVVEKLPGHFQVIDVESYHARIDKPVFVGASEQDCLNYINGYTGSALNFVGRNLFLVPLVPILKIYWLVKAPFRDFVKAESAGVATLSSGFPDQNLEDDRRSIEFAGWLRPFEVTKVGTHPVFNFVRHPPKGFRFTDSRWQRWTVSSASINFLWATWAVALYSFRFLRKGVPFDFIVRFWATRSYARGYLKLKAGKKTLALYPTYLYIIPHHSWIIEIEDMLTMMSPFVANGASNPSVDNAHPIIRILEVLFESKECKGILCHLKATADGLRKIYAHSPKILTKIANIPLGMPVPSEIPRGPLNGRRPINILYLNGWAQDNRATFRRGLLDALKSFSIISKEFGDVTLTVRSQIPELDEEFSEILKNPKIIVLRDKIHHSKLHELYRESDILLFPAVRIAVTTLLQAMANSLAIVASDGFGIEEYIEDGVNGLVAKGFNGCTGWIDGQGIFRENYVYSLSSNPEVVDNCAKHLRRLIVDEEFRIGMQRSARKTLEKRFSMDAWNKELGPVLTEWLRDM